MTPQINFIVCTQSNKAFHTKWHLRPEQKRALIASTSDQACLMYEYFLKMVDVPNVELTDKAIGDYFGWKKHKVKMHRLLLQGAGYFHVEKIKSNAGRAGFVYHVGLDAVSSHLAGTKNLVKEPSNEEISSQVAALHEALVDDHMERYPERYNELL